VDIKKAATLSTGQNIAAGAMGAMVPGIITSVYVTNAIRQSMKTKKRRSVGDLIDSWNLHFFHPRKLEVILARGAERVDNGVGPVPSLDPQNERTALRYIGQTPELFSPSSSTSRLISFSSPMGDKKGKGKEKKGDGREAGSMEEKEGGGNAKQYRLFVVGW